MDPHRMLAETHSSNLIAAALSAAMAASPCGAQCSYFTEVILGAPCPPFGDPTPVYIHDLAPDGTVAGSYRQCYPDDDSFEGFTWTPETGIVTLPRLLGAISVQAVAINAAHQIGVSIQLDCSGCGPLALLYTDGKITLLGPVPGGITSNVSDINELGAAVGWSGSMGTSPPPTATVWNDGITIGIGSSISKTATYAGAISDEGAFLGQIGLGGPTQAFLWDQGKITYLQTLPDGLSSSPSSFGLNETIIGSCKIPDPNPMGWVGRAVVWENPDAAPIDLGTLPPFVHSTGVGMDGKGRIVGTFLNFPGGSGGFVYVAGKMHHLQDLLDTTHDLINLQVRAVNDAGQIAATGWLLHEGLGYYVQVGLRLTPKSASLADLTGDCRVDSKDLGILLSSWGPVGKRNANPAADLDGNGIVNGFDLAMLLAAWG